MRPTLSHEEEDEKYKGEAEFALTNSGERPEIKLITENAVRRPPLSPAVPGTRSRHALHDGKEPFGLPPGIPCARSCADVRGKPLS